MKNEVKPASAYGCPIEAAIDVIGGKWKAPILYHLQSETKRFNELSRLLPGITQRMLTRQLRELESDQIVNRKVYAEVPPKVEYSITEFGLTLVPVLNEIQVWGNEYLGKIINIRSKKTKMRDI